LKIHFVEKIENYQPKPSEKIKINPTMPKEISHSACELRFLELEADYVKKHEELLKTIENLTKSHSEKLNELKKNQARIILFSIYYLFSINTFIY